MLSAKEGGIKYYFFYCLVWLELGMNPGPPDRWGTLYLEYDLFLNYFFRILNNFQIVSC